MSLFKFISHNKVCPICHKPLTLYMQWLRSACFKSNVIQDNVYEFKPLPNTIGCTWTDSSMNLFIYENYIATTFSQGFLAEAKKYQLYFFFLCNFSAFDSNNTINIVKGCYYRSSATMEFKNNNKDWKLEYLGSEDPKLINRDEFFSIERNVNGLDKVYVLKTSYTENTSTLFHYSVDPIDRKKSYYEPKMFEKEFPILKNELDLTDQQKLMDKFQTWILLS